MYLSNVNIQTCNDNWKKEIEESQKSKNMKKTVSGENVTAQVRFFVAF